MKAKMSMFAWNRNSDQIKVGSWPDTTGWSNKFDLTAGACEARVASMNDDQLRAYLFIQAIHVIVGDKVDPISVHNAFCKIDEYRDCLADDMPMP